MEYTIQKLAKISHISTRTLRYYDEINLLKPLRISSSGYRIYGEKEVDRLQQILFYRALGVALDHIKNLLDRPDFNEVKTLENHYQELLAKRRDLDLLIKNVETTLEAKEGKTHMTDAQKFEGFKAQRLLDNEKKYGEELRINYGEDLVAASRKKFQNLSEADYKEMLATENQLLEALKERVPSQKIFELHRKWLSYTWPNYSREAHLGLAEMYVGDSRFTAYYDERAGNGGTQVLKDSIHQYA